MNFMLRNNIIANFIGRIVPGLLTLIFAPIFLRYLGAEAYGLVGFFISLQAVISFLDLGLSTTTNREVAIGFEALDRSPRLPNLARTFEIIYLIISLIIVFGIYIISNWLAFDWINAEELPAKIIRFAILVFGVTLAIRWPLSLYNGILQGSEKQVLFNGLVAIFSLIRIGGSVAVLFFVSNTLLAYLLWQLITAMVEIVVLRNAAWRILHCGNPLPPQIDFSLLREVWKFSISISINSLLAALLKQMDRFLISNLLLLQHVGYYSIVHVIYMTVSMLAIPFFFAAFPRFTALIVSKKLDLLADTYHKIAQSVSFLAAPVTSVLFFFSYDILLVWTHSQDVAVNAAPTLSTLALAAMFNLVMQIPYVLQLATGITWIALWNNAISLAILSPLMYFLISRLGIAGAGVAWAAFNLSYFLIVPHIMHMYILPNEKKAWFFHDVIPFIVLCVFIYGLVYKLYSMVQTQLFLFWAVLMGTIIYIIICLLLYPILRSSVKEIFAKMSFVQIFH